MKYLLAWISGFLSCLALAILADLSGMCRESCGGGCGLCICHGRKGHAGNHEWFMK